MRNFKGIILDVRFKYNFRYTSNDNATNRIVSGQGKPKIVKKLKND